MTDKSASFVYVTYIRTTPEKVFDAITKPEIARRYWGHENVADSWTPGARWQHIRATEARPVELVGEVLESDPPHRLVISWSNESQQHDPDHTSRVAFDIEAQGEMVKLTVSHTELLQDGGMLKGVSKGWPHVLSSLKSYLETGGGLPI